jgi:IclR family pca regulon transcriptional regulator
MTEMRTKLSPAKPSVNPLSAGIGDRPARAPEGMAGLAKGLAILEAFGNGYAALTVADAARLSNITRPAARRCLLTLAALGYLKQEGRVFRPSPRLLRLGAAYLGNAPLVEAARPVLAAARDATGESVSLAVLEGTQALFIARAEAPRIVSTGVRVGAQLPAWCSASGRVLLAALSREQARARIEAVSRTPRTPYTLIETSAILNAVDRARAEGVAINDEELELGMRSMAVPVRDPQGYVAAAMSVSVLSARMTVEQMQQELLPVLREHARMLELAL